MMSLHGDASLPDDVGEEGKSKRKGKLSDIFNYLNNHLSGPEKLSALESVWKPAPDYRFLTRTIKGGNLKFQFQWFAKYPWLAYSEIEEAAFCKVCVLFGKKEGNRQPLGALCTKPFTNWKDDLEVFKDHGTKVYHKDCEKAVLALQKTADEKTVSIDCMLNTAKKNEVLENRKLLMPVITTIILCGRQGLPLRGEVYCG